MSDYPRSLQESSRWPFLLDPSIHAKIKIQQFSMISNHFWVCFFFSLICWWNLPLLGGVRICFSTSLLKLNRSEMLPSDWRENVFYSAEERGFVLSLIMALAFIFLTTSSSKQLSFVVVFCKTLWAKTFAAEVLCERWPSLWYFCLRIVLVLLSNIKSFIYKRCIFLSIC